MNSYRRSDMAKAGEFQPEIEDDKHGRYNFDYMTIRICMRNKKRVVFAKFEGGSEFTLNNYSITFDASEVGAGKMHFEVEGVAAIKLSPAEQEYAKFIASAPTVEQMCASMGLPPGLVGR